ncbi:hypothetical protein JCM6882_003102 [Rhodosporidiobolus microsporus]
MAYNQQQYYSQPGGEYAEHLVTPTRYSDDPFSSGGGAGHGPLPLSHDPEMADLTTRQRPLSAGDYSDSGAASAYWAPGARGSVGGVAGAGGWTAEEWDEPSGGEGARKRKRWIIIAAILGVLAALAIGLGVGLGVGLNNNKSSNDDSARLSGDRGGSSSPGVSQSVGTVVFTSTSFGETGASTITGTEESSTEFDHLELQLVIHPSSDVQLFVQLSNDDSAVLFFFEHDHLSGLLVELCIPNLVRIADQLVRLDHLRAVPDFHVILFLRPHINDHVPRRRRRLPPDLDRRRRRRVNPGGFTIGTLTGYVTVSSS